MDNAVKPGSYTGAIFTDRRPAKTIEPLSGTLDRVLHLRGVTLQWRHPTSQGGINDTQVGLIADEVQKAFPQWAGRDRKGDQTVTVSGFEALTTKALRELRTAEDRQLAKKDCAIAELRRQTAKLHGMVNTIISRGGQPVRDSLKPVFRSENSDEDKDQTSDNLRRSSATAPRRHEGKG